MFGYREGFLWDKWLPYKRSLVYMTQLSHCTTSDRECEGPGFARFCTCLELINSPPSQNNSLGTKLSTKSRAQAVISQSATRGVSLRLSQQKHWGTCCEQWPPSLWSWASPLLQRQKVTPICHSPYLICNVLCSIPSKRRLSVHLRGRLRLVAVPPHGDLHRCIFLLRLRWDC